MKLLIDRFDKIQARKDVGEEDTKLKLLYPLLAILGWDLQEIEEVESEYPSGWDSDRGKPKENLARMV